MKRRRGGWGRGVGSRVPQSACDLSAVGGRRAVRNDPERKLAALQSGRSTPRFSRAERSGGVGWNLLLGTAKNKAPEAGAGYQ